MDRNMRHNSYGGARAQHAMNGKGRAPPPAMARLSPTETPSQHDDLIHYIYESWDKVSREIERGGGAEVKYYQEPQLRQLSNFIPFDLEAWWSRRRVQTIKRHNS